MSEQLPNILNNLLINLPIPSFESIDPKALQIGIIIISIFAFLILLAFTKHHIISTSLKGLWAGFVTGIICVLVIEGAIYVLFRDYVIGQKGATLPKNVRIVLDDGRQNVNKVLGLQTERKNPTAQSVIADYQALSEIDSELVQGFVCKRE